MLLISAGRFFQHIAQTALFLFLSGCDGPVLR